MVRLDICLRLINEGLIECNRASSDVGSRYSYLVTEPTLDMCEILLVGSDSVGKVVAELKETSWGFQEVGLVITT
jgi:hypothetical protein